MTLNALKNLGYETVYLNKEIGKDLTQIEKIKEFGQYFIALKPKDGDS